MRMPVAETYEKEFREQLASFPGGKALQRARKKGMEGFISLGGVPHARAEDWRYAAIAPLRQNHLPRAITGIDKTPALKAVTGWPLAVVHNGRLVKAPRMGGVEILEVTGVLPEWARDFEASGVRENPFERLNLAFADGGILVHAKQETKATKTGGFEIVFMNDGLNDSARYLRNLIVLEEGVSLPVFVRTITTGKSGWVNMVTNASVGRKAKLDLAADFEAPGDVLISSITSAAVGSDASFSHGTVAAGLSSLRHEVEVALNGKGAEASLYGGMLAAKDETLDFLTRIHHIKGGAKSTQSFKGVAGAKGKTAFQGRIIVEEQAQKTDARQNCNNLILDRSGEANVKPELLIFADDVVCTHGATVGEIDEASLFYMMQRGLPEADAKRMLVKAFLGEVVDAFSHDGLHDYFENKINDWMEQNKTVSADE